MDIYEKLKKFDVVLAHTFQVLIGNQNGAVLPNFMEYEKFEQARQYTLDLCRKGGLDGMYERIMKGAV